MVPEHLDLLEKDLQRPVFQSKPMTALTTEKPSSESSGSQSVENSKTLVSDLIDQ